MSEPESYYRNIAYLGQYMKELVPFLFETSCMGDEEREVLAILSYIGDITKMEDLEKLTEEEIMDKMIKPLFQKLGFAHWRRDTVTDMAIRKGLEMVGDSWMKKDADTNPAAPE